MTCGLYDTHAHFEAGDDIAAILARAGGAGVSRIMAVGGSPELNAGALEARKAGCAAVAIGYDRDQALNDLPPLDYTGVDAVGEIGLDYHYSPETREAQLRHFAAQLEIARALVRDPAILMLDEPFAGVDPLSVNEIQDIVRRLAAKGLGIIITDHNVRETLSVVDSAYHVYNGRLLKEGTSNELVNDTEVRAKYLGEDFHM